MTDHPTTQGALLLVGGYGVVGAQAARLLRQLHPGLPLLIGGRHPERAVEFAESIGARAVAVDAGRPRPLGALAERPAAVLGAVSDGRGHLAADAMRLGIPFADIHRAAASDVLDVCMTATRERPTGAVLLAGSWFAGLAALMAAATVRELGGAADRVDVVVLVSSDDRVGPDSWGFADRLAWPHHPMRAGRRVLAQPMTDARPARCADGAVRPAALVGTLEQTTLPVTLGVPTVETRMALQSPASLRALVALKRSGTLRALTLPALRTVRSALLERPGAGDFAGLTVTARGAGRTVSVDLLDPRGQAHLSAVGATWAAERILGPGLPPGVSYPEQSARPEADLDLLRRALVQVRTTGFTQTPRPAHERNRT
ncbi:saccharopine dehydrogenase [Streptomyces sp. NPDC046939]|uniref:saccharopine dehydrogenase n=1 Tax=Streptomyces sp. NPDC046939 TaxID=3155376 RepID=UPI003408A945